MVQSFKNMQKNWSNGSSCFTSGSRKDHILPPIVIVYVHVYNTCMYNIPYMYIIVSHDILLCLIIATDGGGTDVRRGTLVRQGFRRVIWRVCNTNRITVMQQGQAMVWRV